jgi:hypothetical protein
LSGTRSTAAWSEKKKLSRALERVVRPLTARAPFSARVAVWGPIWEPMNPHGVSGPHITHMGAQCERTLWARDVGAPCGGATWARNLGKMSWGCSCFLMWARALWGRNLGKMSGVYSCFLMWARALWAHNVGAQCGSPIWAPYGDMGSAGAHEPIPHAAALFSTADERRPDDLPCSGCVGGVARFSLRPFVVPPRAVLI